MYKYCVASVYVDLVNTKISYYAYQNKVYGLHLVSSWKDENVLWYDTEKEAKEHRFNANDCILSFCTNHIPKFSK